MKSEKCEKGFDMISAIMNGCNGKMGRVITEICRDDPEIEIVAGVDVSGGEQAGYPVYGRIGDCAAKADVIIDFSSPAAVDDLLSYSVERQVPVVLCTTGLAGEQLERVMRASEKTAILKSSNMSLGVNLLIELVRSAAAILAPAGFDMEIIEKHHNQKVDAPSGTALALADAMNEALHMDYSYKYDRTGERQRRDPREIGISSVRGGSIVGQHEVIFAGMDEVVTFEHTAYSRSIFGRGAVEAAKFLVGKTSGLYDMQDVIKATMAQRNAAEG